MYAVKAICGIFVVRSIAMGEKFFVATKNLVLRVAQKIDVIEENPETLEKRIYYSRVEDVRNESLLILPPFQKEYVMPPRIGRIITIKVVSDRIPYLFDATLLKFIAEHLPLWEISKPARVRKIQMRENVRISLILNVKLELEMKMEMKMEMIDPERKVKVINTLTKDLSAGGIQVVLPEKLPIGSKLKIRMSLSPAFTLETTGEIVRLVPPVLESDKLTAGIKFLDLDHRIQNQVIKYIFTKEAENRQKKKEWEI